MARITTHLTSISPDLRTGSPPHRRRALALLLSVMLSISALSPGLAASRELDSEAEGVALPEQAPSPDFDPGGEESALAEAPATGGGGEGESEEAAPVEVEPELDAEAPLPGEVTSAATEADVVAGAPGAQPSTPMAPPTPAPAPLPQPAPAPQPAPVTPEAEAVVQPVENQPLVAPEQELAERSAPDSTSSTVESVPVQTTEAPPPAEPSEEEGTAPRHPAVRSGGPERSLGKRFYVVKPGDCLSHIAAALLPAGADGAAIEREVQRLWRLNEERIGTGDPNLIYVGTVLRLY